jgi:murein hydrolase activator
VTAARSGVCGLSSAAKAANGLMDDETRRDWLGMTDGSTRRKNTTAASTSAVCRAHVKHDGSMSFANGQGHARNRFMLRRSALALSLILPAAAGAQQTRPAEPPSPELRDERALELKRLEENLQRLQQGNAQLATEIASLRGDRARLAAELLASSQRVQEAEARAQAAELRLQGLTQTEEALKRSLESRRGTIVEVLAALQRIGRKPPPALLVSPDDMLQAVRTSMLLGAVLPELRQEAEALAQDLGRLVATREAMARERDTLAAEAGRLAQERERLQALIAARQSQLALNETRLQEDRQKAQQIARQAGSLKELIARMEAEISASSRAAQLARGAPQPTQSPTAVAALQPGAVRDLARLQPRIPFQEARGSLVLPVSGKPIKGFGASDGGGGRESGMSLETARYALVTSPADGWVSFAGPYRSFGHVLIINAGGGYHLVMTGIDRVNVDVGQFVLSGEPVATMGAQPAGALAPESGGGGPVLYIEFRKDGAPIDPSPWWAKSDGEKVRG